jgi:hypothetical protein
MDDGRIFTVERLFSGMDEQLEKRVSFLRAAGTEGMPHTEHGLLSHLLGTRQLLVDWDARPAVCDAGLFHSVYGTERYEGTAIPLSRRVEVRQLIGDEAEALAWLFGVMRRKTFDQNLGRPGEFTVQHRLTNEWLPLTTTQFHDLVTMTFANTLEAFPRMSWIMRRNCRRYFRRFRRTALAGAQKTFDGLDARWWELWK